MQHVNTSTKYELTLKNNKKDKQDGEGSIARFGPFDSFGYWDRAVGEPL